MDTIDPTDRIGSQMARLNTTHANFDTVGDGGVPSLTPQDVAAALGMVPEGLGLELLTLVHWPDGSRRRRGQMLEMMTLIQLEEHNRREQDVARALCQVAIATTATKGLATRTYSEAHLRRWPLWVTRLDTVTLTRAYEYTRLGVIEELSHPRQCLACKGLETCDRAGKKTHCEKCSGTGVVRYGSTWRATRLGMKRAAFIENWKDPYDWLMDICMAAFSEAEAALHLALR